MSAHITRPHWREILHDAATTQHMAALTWTECNLALSALVDLEDQVAQIRNLASEIEAGNLIACCIAAADHIRAIVGVEAAS